MIREKFFGKKFKKVISLCLAGCLAFGAVPVSVEAAKVVKDTKRPTIKQRIIAGVPCTDGNSENWIMVTATDDVKIDSVSVYCNDKPAEKIATPFVRTSKKSITRCFKVGDTKDIIIVAKDAAGNKFTLQRKVNPPKEVLFTKKIDKVVDTTKYDKVVFDGKKLKSGKSVKIKTAKEGSHVLKYYTGGVIFTTHYIVDNTKPKVEYSFDKNKANGSARPLYITSKEFHIKSVTAYYKDGRKEVESRFFSRFSDFLDKKSEYVQIEKVVVKDAAGNSTTVKIKEPKK